MTLVGFLLEQVGTVFEFPIDCRLKGGKGVGSQAFPSQVANRVHP